MTDDLKTRVEKVIVKDGIVSVSLQTTMMLVDLVDDLYAEVQRLKERLEEGYGFDINGTRVECPDIPDGIFARDCTIEVLEEENKILKEKNQTLIVQNKAYENLKRAMDESEPSYRRSYYKLQAEYEKLKPTIQSVDSERDMNSRLTEENQRLEQENAALRENLKFSDEVNIAQRKLYEKGREADELLIKDLYLICDGNDLLAPKFEDKICKRLYDFSELSDAQDPVVQKMRKKQALKEALAAKGGEDE